MVKILILLAAVFAGIFALMRICPEAQRVEQPKIVATQVARPQAPEPTVAAPKPGPVIVNKRDFLCMLHVLYKEAGAEPRDGQIAVAYVMKARAADKHTGICPVVYASKTKVMTAKAHGPMKGKRIVHVHREFDGVGPVADFRELEPLVDIVVGVLSGTLQPDPEIVDARYFYWPEGSSKGGNAWFQNNTVCLKQIGHHWFCKDKPQQPVVAASKVAAKQ